MIEFLKIQETIKNAPPGVKRLMFSQDFGIQIQNIGDENKLDDEQFPKFVDEVGYVILGLKKRFDFSNSLIETGMQKELADKIAKEVETKIFTQIDKPIKTQTYAPAPVQKQSAPEVKKDNVGDSYEQAIINQAKAMMPAKPAQEHHTAPPPINLPTDLPKVSVASMPVAPSPVSPTAPEPKMEMSTTPTPPPVQNTPIQHENDPYREPLE